MNKYNSDLILSATKEFQLKLIEAGCTTSDEQIHILMTIVSGITEKAEIDKESVIRLFMKEIWNMA